MQLLKIRDGLLERDNFYLTSEFGDFLGIGTTRRDSDSFYIDGTERIERRFPYQSFVLDIQKENWETMEEEDRIKFYIGDTVDEYGITENWDEQGNQKPYLRIIVTDGYVQTYSSETGSTWENLGGADLYGKTVVKQGFLKEGSKSFKMIDYKLYSDPYLTVQNFPENYKAILYSSDGTKIKERLFSHEEEAKIFLDNSLFGYVEVYDLDNNKVFTGEITEYKQGDVYIACEFELELIYKERVLPKEEITSIGTFGTEYVTLKNISTTSTYNNLKVSTLVESSDIIKLSTDEITFTPEIIIPSLAPDEEIDIFISIERQDGSSLFVVRDFIFKVE